MSELEKRVEKLEKELGGYRLSHSLICPKCKVDINENELKNLPNLIYDDGSGHFEYKCKNCGVDILLQFSMYSVWRVKNNVKKQK